MPVPYYDEGGIQIFHGDCRDVMPSLAPASALVSDPPYGLSFMGKGWDKGVPGPGFWRLANLLPGAHLMAFGGTRTYHRLACAIEDAGFEIRDCLAWMYGSGFPKSLDVSKAIDNAAGVDRDVVGKRGNHRPNAAQNQSDADPTAWQDRSDGLITAPATDAAKEWNGWGTALKPAFEPVVLARRPLIGTVAANVQEHGAGALNVDGCRVPGAFKSGWSESGSKASENRSMSGANTERDPKPDNPAGRWPANVVLDEEAARILDEQTGERPASRDQAPTESGNASFGGGVNRGEGFNDSGGASRFFYTAKASRAERNGEAGGAKNDHPTVKPIDLMRWLVRLVTPPGGVVLDPFMGSGTTLVAARDESYKAIGIEIEERYCEIAAKRLAQGVLPFGDGQ